VFITDLKLWTLDFSYLIFMYGAGLNPAPFCYAAYAGTPFGQYSAAAPFQASAFAFAASNWVNSS